MNRQGAIVQEPTFFTLRITSALTIVYTFQIFLLTATFILFPSIYLFFHLSFHGCLPLLNYCILHFFIHLETPLIVYLTKSGSDYFKSLHEAEYIEEESIATMKIEEQSRPKEVPELSVTDLCRQASSETESCASTEESDIDSINLPAPINKFHSISLDSYHDCKDN
ncbi:hypothetical protein PRIPAC_95826 [Pristionchus pacificus]|uniref:Uncharacterized protein n=1 Tax=Pristionchus pacificus TaxID=54126 RepID=A0A2A6BC06_PRIPA|nr:hypothetical protein PRIPAC_95826 [Pristionchus pacificus]|eukprot:PDM63394.1 hypothetical protein PRIPAC_53751 [Pristionchus pacificus]